MFSSRTAIFAARPPAFGKMRLGVMKKIAPSPGFFREQFHLKNLNWYCMIGQGFQTESEAPELARPFQRELTRTRKIETSADALRYGTTGNAEKNRE
ncbi:hypothetical protein [Caproicibacter sp. BJN0012]|uniref:hypothetical protein n=1 Tax=Caproicibacter sp. BJN0012 TaxID=3110227 RepID=UPI002E10235B